jgi:hypothetical protein
MPILGGGARGRDSSSGLGGGAVKGRDCDTERSSISTSSSATSSNLSSGHWTQTSAVKLSKVSPVPHLKIYYFYWDGATRQMRFSDSVLRIRDVYPGSRIRIRIKVFQYF